MTLGLKTTLKQILLGTVVASALIAAPIITLSPGGARSGTPGSTVGWGFTLTNDLNWIEVVQAQFCLDSPLGNPCFSASLQFFDIISNPPHDVIVGPAGFASEIWDPGSNLGLGSFTIDPGAANGSSVAGNILLTYNVFDADPNLGGNQIGFDEAISASASVTATSSTATPEPATWGLAGIALAGLAARRRGYRG